MPNCGAFTTPQQTVSQTVNVIISTVCIPVPSQQRRRGRGCRLEEEGDSWRYTRCPCTKKKRVLRSSAGDVNKSSSGERLREKRRFVSWGKQTEIDLFKKKHEKNRGKRSFMSATDLNFAVFMAVFANRPTVVFAIITPTNIHPFQRFCTATAFFLLLVSRWKKRENVGMLKFAEACKTMSCG